MSNYEQYNSRSLADRADIVRENGLLLESKEVGDKYLQLYQLDDFYVVVVVEAGFKLVQADAYSEVPEDWRKNY